MAESLLEQTVAEIMRQWPVTIGVFIDLHLHCVGCPVAAFQTLSDAAHEHGIEPGELLAEIEAAIAGRRERQVRPANRSSHGRRRQ